MILAFAGLVVASVLVGLGYVVLWAAGRQDTPRGISSFGRVLAIVLFCIAGLTLLLGFVAGPMMMGAGRGPGGGPGMFFRPGGCLGCAPQREIRTERRFGPGGEPGERQALGEESDEEPPELEEQVRGIVEDVMSDEDFEARVQGIVRGMQAPK